MKLRKMLRLGLVMAAFSSLVFFATAQFGHAQVFQPTVHTGNTIDSSLYASGKTVTIDGVVNGDVYCAGQAVTITGTVHGDVLCVSQSLTIAGTVDGNVRIAAQTVTISGHVGKNATIAGATAALVKGSSIDGDATLLSATVSADGTIGRDMFVTSSVATVSGTVGRNFRSNQGQVTLASGGHIKGAFTYISSTPADTSAGRIDGYTTHTLPVHKSRSMFAGLAPARFAYVLIAGMLFSLVLILVLPQTVNRLADYPTRKLGKTILTGFLGSFGLPMIVLVLFISVIGTPLGIVGLLAEVVFAMLSGPIAAYYIGSMVMARSHNAIAIMAVGSVIVILLCFIPFVGVLAVLLAYFIGLGALLQGIRDGYTKPVYKVE